MKKDPSPLVAVPSVFFGGYVLYFFLFHTKEALHGHHLDNIFFGLGIFAAVVFAIIALCMIIGAILEIIGIIIFIAKGGGRGGRK